ETKRYKMETKTVEPTVMDVTGDSQLPGDSSEGASSDGAQTSSSSGARQRSYSPPGAPKKKEPMCIIVLGMAGSGKTTFVKRLDSHLNIRKPHHVINLDPAVDKLPYISYIDIRDTVNYKEVMKQYGLGPNGGIVTSLNLFSTMFDDVLKLIAKKEEELDYVIFDTPGQIEVFNWSASGPIIAGALAATYPTIIVYVLDSVRSTNPQTFMSNMLYACSILYKYKLPFIIAMNKIDIVDCKYAMNWLQDFDEFQDALSSESTYASNLTRSLSLALEEFYSTIKACGGMDAFMHLTDEAAIEFEDYRSEHEMLKMKKKSREEEREKGAGLEHKQLLKDTEIYLTHGSDSEGEGEVLDEEDTMEKKELESFQQFLSNQKAKREHQRYNVLPNS
ncbi:GPN-loop GTPase 1-like, partial [Homarus americanus]